MIGCAGGTTASTRGGYSPSRDGSSILLAAEASNNTSRGQILGTAELLRRFRVAMNSTTNKSGL